LITTVNAGRVMHICPNFAAVDHEAITERDFGTIRIGTSNVGMFSIACI
jgi:hypothetical protein